MMMIDKQHVMSHMKWIENDGKIQVNYTHPNPGLKISCGLVLEPRAHDETGVVLWSYVYPECKPEYESKDLRYATSEDRHFDFDVALSKGLSKIVNYVNHLVDERVPKLYHKSEESKAYHKGLAYMAKVWSHRHETATDG